MDWQLLLSIIGAAAWIPIVIGWFIAGFRKIHFVYLDRHIVYNVTKKTKKYNTITEQKGMCLLVAVNLFVYGKPYFPKDISCEIKLKDGAIHKADAHSGTIGYSDTNGDQHDIIIPPVNNIHINRIIDTNKNNIKILTFFVENLNMENDENIEYIKVKFKGHFLQKLLY